LEDEGEVLGGNQTSFGEKTVELYTEGHGLIQKEKTAVLWPEKRYCLKQRMANG